MHISFWYGAEQRFGHLGQPQERVNILGTATPADKVQSLCWSLNAGPEHELSMGPDGYRLAEPGDFNIELRCQLLHDGLNLVEVTAVDLDGGICRERVTVDYCQGRAWPLPCHIDLRDTTCITEDVQVVDGQWHATDRGVRTTVAAYDRLLTLGDLSWTSYRTTVAATIHGFRPPRIPDKPIGGFGILVHWSGHQPDQHQPCREWRPNGAICWYRADWDTPDLPRKRVFSISDAVVKDTHIVHSAPYDLPTDTSYVYEATVRMDEHHAGWYRYRVWPESDPGCILCDLQAKGLSGHAPRGSVLLIALSVDITITQIDVTPV